MYVYTNIIVVDVVIALFVWVWIDRVHRSVWFVWLDLSVCVWVLLIWLVWANILGAFKLLFAKLLTGIFGKFIGKLERETLKVCAYMARVGKAITR